MESFPLFHFGIGLLYKKNNGKNHAPTIRYRMLGAIFRSEFGNSESKFSYVVDEWQNSQIP